MTAPNIHEHTKAICEALGLEPDFVRSMTITHNKVVAGVYLKNDDGRKYIRDTADGEDREIATETRTYKVIA